MPKNVRVLLVAILAVWLVFLTVVSLSPVVRSKLGRLTSRPARIIRVKLGFDSVRPLGQFATRRDHRLAHLISFGFFSFLLALLCRSAAGRWLALGAVVALGVLIEVSQHLIYRNPLETWDIRDDTCGAIAGFLAAALLLYIGRLRGNRFPATPPAAR